MPFSLEVAGAKIVVVRTGKTVYAFHDVCPHAFWPLSAGSFRDGVIECPGHAWEFDVQTGVCIDSPSYCLTSVSTTVDGEFVRLEWRSEAHDPGKKCGPGSLAQKSDSLTTPAITAQSAD